MISGKFMSRWMGASLAALIGFSLVGCSSGKQEAGAPKAPAGTTKEAETPTNQSDAAAVTYQLNICSDSLADIRDSLEQVAPAVKGDAKTNVEEASVMAEDLGVGLEQILDDVEKIPESNKARWKELFTELSDALVDLEALGERVETLATSEGRGGTTDSFSKLTASYEASWAALDESIDLAAKVAGVAREVPEA